ncbi:hypothetical protein ACN38_g5448 [Penicillium nordicum]|uniref:Uncharacterized protein n=1 Tax=Penicillium nordicum TaxID=229535 RepID=A0A0M9WG70_9EURO|nr:hypothetical protein ACN38_g5448 [Penicillium nordicum]
MVMVQRANRHRHRCREFVAVVEARALNSPQMGPSPRPTAQPAVGYGLSLQSPAQPTHSPLMGVKAHQSPINTVLARIE